MTDQINLEYDTGLQGFVVVMPEHVTLDALNNLRERLFAAIATVTTMPFCLLIDTNRHDFESIDCLRGLREVLEAPQFVNNCARVAFVQPRQYQEPHMESDQVGYFDNVEEARGWLKAWKELS